MAVIAMNDVVAVAVTRLYCRLNAEVYAVQRDRSISIPSPAYMRSC